MRKWIWISSLVGVALWSVGMALPRERAAPARAAAAADGPGGSRATASRPRASWYVPALESAPSLDAQLDAWSAALREAPDEVDFDHARSRVFVEMRTQIRANPALVKKLEAMLSTADRDKPMASLAVGALAAAGTPDAQAALARLVDVRKNDVAFLELLVPTMGFTVRPTPALEGALRRLAGSDASDEVRGMAHLALGTAVSRLQTEDPARARSIIDSYDAKLARATSSDEMSTYLAVLGNAGTADAARVAARYVDDARSEVRAEALRALRLVPTDEAQHELTAALRHDGDGSVRASAASALSYRPATAALARAEADALAAERDGSVAKQLLENLWGARAGNGGPDALAAITSAAESHPLAAVRDRARALLAEAAPAPPHG